MIAPIEKMNNNSLVIDIHPAALLNITVNLPLRPHAPAVMGEQLEE